MSSHFKWNTNNADKSKPYVVVLMISRNKDNKNVEGFKERKWSYLTTRDMDKIERKFKYFVNEGVKGEMSRLYISLNTREPKLIKNELLHMLIDKDDFVWDYIEPTIASIAARKEFAAEKQWFFDFDSNIFSEVQEFIKDVKYYSGQNDVSLKASPNGYAVIVKKGFDTRELLAKWGEKATLKRDDLIIVEWSKKV